MGIHDMYYIFMDLDFDLHPLGLSAGYQKYLNCGLADITKEVYLG